MNLLKLFCLLLGLSAAGITFGQDYLKRFQQLDVLQYDLKINLDLENKYDGQQNKIVVREDVTIQFLQKSDSFQLDLVGRFQDSLGMKVSMITMGKTCSKLPTTLTR